jgi:hypothetical protein
MFQLPRFRNAYLFQRPINMRWGENKLTALCKEEIGVEPKVGDAFLFYNRKQDSLKLFFRDHQGPNDVQKLLTRGGFMLPAPVDGQAFTKIVPSLIPRLFSR